MLCSTSLLISTVFRGKLVCVHGSLGGSPWADGGCFWVGLSCNLAQSLTSVGQKYVPGRMTGKEGLYAGGLGNGQRIEVQIASVWEALAPWQT